MEIIDIQSIITPNSAPKISKILIESRKINNKTQAEVSEQIEKDAITVRRYENGDIRDTKTLFAIANAYGPETVSAILQIISSEMHKIEYWDILENFSMSNLARIKMLSSLYFSFFDKEPSAKELFTFVCDAGSNRSYRLNKIQSALLHIA